MAAGMEKCLHCECMVANLGAHVCDETVLHAKQTAGLQQEFTPVRIGAAFEWRTFNRWLTTPAGLFAIYLARH